MLFKTDNENYEIIIIKKNNKKIYLELNVEVII